MRTSELTDIALDRAVAKCNGVNEETFKLYYEPTEPADYDSHGYPEFHYSTIWAQGGPIIEREKIATWLNGDDEWAATDGIKTATGDTPLIAAMRCYVASKLGEEVDIPKELL